MEKVRVVNTLSEKIGTVYVIQGTEKYLSTVKMQRRYVQNAVEMWARSTKIEGRLPGR